MVKSIQAEYNLLHSSNISLKNYLVGVISEYVAVRCKIRDSFN